MAARQLIEELLGQDPNLEFPPDAEAWSVEALQTFYDTAGAILPDEPDESVLPAPPAPMPAGADSRGTCACAAYAEWRCRRGGLEPAVA